MRIGVIGVGRMGSFHAATLRRLDVVDDLVVADAAPDRAKMVAAALEATPVAGLDELLDRKPHGVVIAASTPANAALLGQCVDAGIPVYCEKPVTLDAGQCRALVERVASTRVEVQIGFQRRFDQRFLAVRQAVVGGELGDLCTIRMVSCDREPPHAGYIPASGGIFKDLQIHDYDLLHWLTGQEVQEVYAMGADHGPGMFAASQDFSTAVTLARLRDGTLATLVAGRYHAAGYDVRAELAGTKGTMAAGVDPRTPVRYPGGWPGQDETTAYEGFIDRFGGAYQAAIHAFIDLVRGIGPNPCPPTEALKALVVAEAVRRSIDEGQPVRVTTGGSR